MFHLIYVSSAVNLFSEEQLQQLLDVSRVNNSKSNLTGMLLYLGGNFIQVLEGEEDDVRTTHQRIASDTRHHGMLVLLQGKIAEREFPDWSMGYRRIDREGTGEIPGYSDFLTQKAAMEKGRVSALRLMDHFKNINR